MRISLLLTTLVQANIGIGIGLNMSVGTYQYFNNPYYYAHSIQLSSSLKSLNYINNIGLGISKGDNLSQIGFHRYRSFENVILNYKLSKIKFFDKNYSLLYGFGSAISINKWRYSNQYAVSFEPGLHLGGCRNWNKIMFCSETPIVWKYLLEKSSFSLGLNLGANYYF